MPLGDAPVASLLAQSVRKNLTNFRTKPVERNRSLLGPANSCSSGGRNVYHFSYSEHSNKTPGSVKNTLQLLLPNPCVSTPPTLNQTPNNPRPYSHLYSLQPLPKPQTLKSTTLPQLNCKHRLPTPLTNTPSHKQLPQAQFRNGKV